MFLKLWLATVSVFVLSLTGLQEANGQCDGQESITFKALKFHTFKTWLTENPSQCLKRCQDDARCQSLNFVIRNGRCELNNRTKEAKPKHFIADMERFYMKRWPKGVVLGSVVELPADSCKEIKLSENGAAASGIYWLDPVRSGKIFEVYCDMNTEVADFCLNHQCVNRATCVSTYVNYTCACAPGWTGNLCQSVGDYCFAPQQHQCKNRAKCVNGHMNYTCSCVAGWNGSLCELDVNECVLQTHGCDGNASCINTAGSFRCSCNQGYSGDGKTCRESTDFDDSAIISRYANRRQAYIDKLASYLAPVLQSGSNGWHKCYQATVNGWATSTFHSRCNLKGPTVTIVRYGSYVFGGYTRISWQSTSSRSYNYRQDSSAFLFTLYNINGYYPQKLAVTKAQYAIYDRYSYLSTFGGGHDLMLRPSSSTSYVNCHSYTCPRYRFVSSTPFVPNEVEVFYETTT